MNKVYHCHTCNETDPDKFHKGCTTECKTCSNARHRVYKTKARRAAGVREYKRDSHTSETIKERNKRAHENYRRNYPEKVKESNKRAQANYRKNHPDRVAARRKITISEE